LKRLHIEQMSKSIKRLTKHVCHNLSINIGRI
jgi:hypothetical protein